MGEVIDFKTKRIETKMRETNEHLEDAEGLVVDIMDELDEILLDYGFTERDEEFAKQFYYVMESVRALVLGYMEIDHPFQSVIDKMVDTTYDDKTNSYYVYWKEKDTVKKMLDQEDDIE